MRSHLTAQTLYSQNRVDGVAARHAVFRLQFFAGARREAHAEVRQAVVPRAGDAHLLRAVRGREFGDRVQVPRRQFSSEKLRRRVESSLISNATLDPDL